MPKLTVRDLNVRGKRVFVRVDYNVPLEEKDSQMVITDATRKAQHWKPEWAPFYKDTYKGADFILIEVKPFRLEVDSPGRGLLNDPRTWRPVVLNIP